MYNSSSVHSEMRFTNLRIVVYFANTAIQVYYGRIESSRAIFWSCLNLHTILASLLPLKFIVNIYRGVLLVYPGIEYLLQYKLLLISQQQLRCYACAYCRVHHYSFIPNRNNQRWYSEVVLIPLQTVPYIPCKVHRAEKWQAYTNVSN